MDKVAKGRLRTDPYILNKLEELCKATVSSVITLPSVARSAAMITLSSTR